MRVLVEFLGDSSADVPPTQFEVAWKGSAEEFYWHVRDLRGFVGRSEWSDNVSFVPASAIATLTVVSS